MDTTLPALDAALNLGAVALLLAGRAAARAGALGLHRGLMLAAVAVSTLFLAVYLVHHARVGHVPFRGEGPVRALYLSILLTHTVLAACVPPLVLRTLWLAWMDRRADHRWWAVRTWPVWLYVSVTGVVVYAMLYHLPA